MKRFAFKLFNIICLISVSKSKKLLWATLENVIRKTYPKVNGGTGFEEYCWKKIAHNFERPTIIDIGANHGRLSDFYLSTFPGANVYAVEPIKEFFDKIDDSRLTKFNLALSNKQKTLTLYQSGKGSKPFPKDSKGKKTGAFSVRALPGDDFVKEFKINKVDIIKIDTEGFDFEVLQGFKEVIKKEQPFIQFELSKWWLKMGYTLKQAMDMFEDLNYDLYYMTDKGFKNVTFELPDSLFVTMNIFAKPKDKLRFLPD